MMNVTLTTDDDQLGDITLKKKNRTHLPLIKLLEQENGKNNKRDLVLSSFPFLFFL